MEELSLEPQIVMFHEIITEEQIDVVQTLAKPEIERSQVRNGTYSRASALYRISKGTWFAYSKHRALKKLEKDVEYATSLVPTSYEKVQVVNYGIGGHYEPHVDFFPEDTVKAVSL